MDNGEMERILRQIAENNGMSIVDVRREIELAIEEARENPDVSIQAFWKSVPRKGDKPTIEEVILHIAGIIDEM